MSATLRAASLVGLLLAMPGVALAAKGKAEKAKEEAKPAEKMPVAGNKLAVAFQKTFKLWDKNKDASVDKEELEKFYAKLKAKPKKKGNAARAAEDPLAPVSALLTKADADGDGKISKAEFDDWSGQFADYAANYSELMTRRAATERELANLAALAASSGNVTAADGIFQQEARRGLTFYKQTLEEIDGKLKELDAEGHSEYWALFMPQRGR